ncbi:MAG TPA: isoleucine--tRNA ligase [Tepidisphaeraceae bacterium]|nr:isoleucine--tRNA ligase [Tepidisphaeraceae bacterium]
MANKKSYKDTLNLPQTAFPMEAKLVQNEPARLQGWQERDLYKAVQDARARTGKGQFVLHDGPPFANGDIHIGHVINKTLKDVVLRFKTMQGYQTPYVPGWDCHGLPIEHKIQQDLGKGFREMDVVDVRRRCYEYAAKYAGIQSEQFQRLGILGQWDDPYWTMKPQYEAATLEVFAKFVEAGLVYKQLKPVPWSIANQTALADAELEYKDVDDTSVYVEFPVANPGAFKGQFDVRLRAEVSFLIWTTTPWTLPANMAIAVGPDVEYAFVKFSRDGKLHVTVVAADLVERVMAKGAAGGATDVEVLKTLRGHALVGDEYRHPFVDRVGKILTADYVTTTDGTGLVHTAPGHGEEDYATGLANGIEVYSPVLANGRFDSTVPNWLVGLTVWEGNPKVIEKLKELGALFAQETIRHSYPHDWRSKTPTIFRATEQWFVGIDKPFTPANTLSGRAEGPRSLRDRAKAAVTDAKFVPEWGRARITGMLDSRPDWNISRQRAWGLPIPVFYNEAGDPLLTPGSVRAVAKRFAEKGSDAWFTDSPADLLGDFDPGPNFPKDKLRKEKDIFDVWFESGSSWHAVLQARPYLRFPADLYLEGSDQHRGWFQLSLLPALGATGQPPFKSVLTHGFVVKPDGTKVSKSDKEYVKAVDEINRHGADLLRLWCSSVDYQNDIPASPKALQEFGDKYRKIRNTLRYLLSNLYDYPDPTGLAASAASIPPHSLDAWALAQLDTLIREVTASYDQYQLHRAFRLLHDFCAVQISAVYGNAMKDRLYCEAPDAPLRRRCQSVMHRMVVALTKLLAPMLVFTADETWQFVPHKSPEDAGAWSVHLALLPEPSGVAVPKAQRAEWQLLMDLRDAALGQLDALKKGAGLNKASEAEVVYAIPDADARRRLQAYGPDLEDLVGAGYHSFADASGSAASVQVIDRRNDYPACARSWKRRPDVGSDQEYPDLSARDAQAVKARR